MKNKKEIRIRPFWYSDIWVWPKMIAIITSMDKDGKVNAAPYSHIMQYDVMTKNPRMMVGFRQGSHSFRNISDTGEFVVNCPSADYLDDMMQTARFWPDGVNELEHTRFTAIPSRKVKPPSIAECPQIAECTVDQIIHLEKSSGIIIAKIEAIVMDEGLEEMDRGDRLKAMNLPVGLGDQNRKYYYHAYTDHVVMHELEEPPGGHLGGDIKTNMDWDANSLQALMAIPVNLRKMVADQVEDFVRSKNSPVVTMPLFADMCRENGINEEFFARFVTK